MAWVSGYRVWLTESQSLQNAQEIANYFIVRGWTRNAISAMLGNMRHESSVNPNMYEYGYDWSADRGFGLVQWTPRSKFTNWASSRGLVPEAALSQLARIDFEADQRIQWIATNSYPFSFAEFRASTSSVDYLTKSFTWNYERPNASAGAASMPARIAFAKRCYNELNWNITSTPVPNPDPTDPTDPPDPPDPIDPQPEPDELPPWEELPSEPAPVTWQLSSASAVEVLWTPFETIVPVNPEKELLTTTIEVYNEEPFLVFFDDLTVQKNLLNDKLLAANVTYIPFDGVGSSDAVNMTIFGALGSVKVVSVHYIPEETITGSASVLALKLIHDPTGNILATKTFIEGVVATARAVTDFGPIAPSFSIIPPTSSLRIVKEGNVVLPKGLFIIQWDVA